ncbi:sulfite exporter TauE/SafE family protein [Mesonia aestuariivivens]|uniref:Probable membrane transporter protein n=1 Tax=Mesonia aestuariivivens TaxID=2796128 RepID=A0ABS6W0W8_9FLAO|nr:sulfite exporter TauE/SafE family protein [Mesonia aestuariivivens]MBW2961464.1 sulfite exporter TauE/SafE family protein [Mesonia aestuariivivens]
MLISILGFIAALIIGIVLGLTGGGGSILTVPVFVYLLGIDPVLATGYSLFVVGISSAFGAIKNLQKGLVNFGASLVFAVPAVIAVFSTRKFIISAIPNVIIKNQHMLVTKDAAIMVFFAILMLAASFSMILNNKRLVARKMLTQPKKTNYLTLGALGLFTGLVTGLVGAGGGFIIVPILIFLAKLPIKKAAATSLFIIALNSLIGFLGDALQIEIDWMFLLSFSAFAVLGILLGISFSKFIDGAKLKKGFGFLVLIMGIYIFYKEMMM